jgi:hypothetical protein
METRTDELRRTFAGTLARTALGDIEGAIDRALKRSGLTGRQVKGLVALRERAVKALCQITKGRDKRLPAAVLEEVLAGIFSILHPDAKQAIAKSAPTEGRIVAGQRVVVAKMPWDREKAPAPGEMTRHEKNEAFIAMGAELKALIESCRKAFKKLKAEDQLDAFHRDLSRTMIALAFAGDLQAARAEMDKAPAQLAAMLDQTQLDQAFAEAKSDAPEWPAPNGKK